MTRPPHFPATGSVAVLAPTDPYQARKSRSVAAWVAGALFLVVLGLLVFAMQVSGA